MASAGQWFAGARPRTLPAAVAPVMVGAGLAAHVDRFWVGRAALALVVSVALQIGVNYANDYSDGIKGTDAVRVGPVRLVGQGLAAPRRVRSAAFVSFGVAAVAGLVLVVLTGQWWLLLVGAASIAAAWFYTGGPRPYGYVGLGELFVFVFFGLVPVIGTAYVQTLTITATDVVAAVGVGLLACAILVANNLRDIPNDATVGKVTLAVRLGDTRTREFYICIVALAMLVPVILGAMTSPWVMLASISAVAGVRPVRVIASGAKGRDLIPVLKDTGLLLLVYGLLLGSLLAVT